MWTVVKQWQQWQQCAAVACSWQQCKSVQQCAVVACSRVLLLIHVLPEWRISCPTTECSPKVESRSVRRCCIRSWGRLDIRERSRRWWQGGRRRSDRPRSTASNSCVTVTGSPCDGGSVLGGAIEDGGVGEVEEGEGGGAREGQGKGRLELSVVSGL